MIAGCLCVTVPPGTSLHMARLIKHSHRHINYSILVHCRSPWKVYASLSHPAPPLTWHDSLRSVWMRTRPSDQGLTWLYPSWRKCDNHAESPAFKAAIMNHHVLRNQDFGLIARQPWSTSRCVTQPELLHHSTCLVSIDIIHLSPHMSAIHDLTGWVIHESACCYYKYLPSTFHHTQNESAEGDCTILLCQKIHITQSGQTAREYRIFMRRQASC